MVFSRVSGIASNEIFGELISTTVKHTPSTETDAPVTRPSVETVEKSITKRITSFPSMLDIFPVPATIPVNILSPQLTDFCLMKVPES